MLSQNKDSFVLKSIPGKNAPQFAKFGILYDIEAKKVINKDRYYCRICFDEYDEVLKLGDITSYNASTSSGVYKRLCETVHKVDFASASKKDANQPSIVNCFGGSDLSLDYDITLWFIKDDISFNEVTNEGFVDFFSKRFNSKVPSRTTLTQKCLPELKRVFCDYLKKFMLEQTLSM